MSSRPPTSYTQSPPGQGTSDSKRLADDSASHFFKGSPTTGPYVPLGSAKLFSSATGKLSDQRKPANSANANNRLAAQVKAIPRNQGSERRVGTD